MPVFHEGTTKSCQLFRKQLEDRLKERLIDDFAINTLMVLHVATVCGQWRSDVGGGKVRNLTLRISRLTICQICIF